jgi:hypothetical protein
LPFSSDFLQNGADTQTNLRFIHPNGMTATDYNTILILVSNETEAQGVYQDSAPSGIYEYDPQIGLYHKYAISSSEIGSTTITDYGNHRVEQVGAIYFARSTTAAAGSNGTILAGAQVNLTSSTSEYVILTNDTLKTTQAYGYFVTNWLFSNDIEDTWKEIYAVYKRIIESSDKIVVKYRTVEKNSVTADCDWLNATQFTTTDDLSDVSAGYEVTILQGGGAGQTMKITDITSSANTYTVTVESNPLSASTAFTGLFQNFIYAGTITNADRNQWKKFALPEATTSPMVQFKVEMYLTDGALHKLEVPNKNHVTQYG